MIRRRYIDGRWGQIHLRENGEASGATLVCLHATAYSSRTFAGVLAALDGRRRALAIDTPGYGESDPPPAPPSIADYADVLAAAVSGAVSGPVDLFGYHTGVSIAVEWALRHPATVGRLVLMGVPHFRALDFDVWRDKLAARHELGGSLDQFAERWRFFVDQRPDGVTLDQGFANFVDELKAWPNGWWAHEALFAHEFAGRLAAVTHPVTILNPPGHLADPSRVAAALVAHAEVIELTAVGPAPLLTDAKAIARLL